MFDIFEKLIKFQSSGLQFMLDRIHLHVMFNRAKVINGKSLKESKPD